MPVKIDKDAPRRYKHTLRKAPYLFSLVFLLLATTLTLLNIYVGRSSIRRLTLAVERLMYPQVADLVHVVVKSPGPLEFETK